MQLQILNDIKERKSTDESDTLLMELEWCGSYCSGKYSLLLLPFGNTASDQYQSSIQGYLYVSRVHNVHTYICIMNSSLFVHEYNTIIN